MTGHAVVLGAGIAGLLAASVLAEHFPAVTVVERDRLPANPIDRRGAPQGRHLHSLLSRGSHTFEQLLPGFLDELAAAGALVLDDPDLHRIYTRTGRYTLNRAQPVSDPAALVTYQASRPFLEFHLRRRVAAVANVTIRDGHDVGDLVAAEPDRITGVTVCDRATGASEILRAELTVDATGRGARTPVLLERLGHSRSLEPPEDPRGGRGGHRRERTPEPHRQPRRPPGTAPRPTAVGPCGRASHLQVAAAAGKMMRHSASARDQG
ncbi:NAD(P)/FAD-dependent oxidoreductase [Mycobacterium sp. 050134]|uniref:NAD(P)/FAD-dependent oxidoreductase n=1 Tax=Mycobacterium sp. 050134 TaxID=3096111 RepID=UPI002ED97948